MEYNRKENYPLDKQPTDTYDDGDIPQIDLPRDSFPIEMPTPVFPTEMPMDVIPDEVPRRDGPGGDGEMCE